VAIQKARPAVGPAFVDDAMTARTDQGAPRSSTPRSASTGVVLTRGTATSGRRGDVGGVGGRRAIAVVGSGETLRIGAVHPERVVSRSARGWRVLSLIERAEAQIDVEDAEKLEQKRRDYRVHTRGFSRITQDHQEDGAARAAHGCCRDGQHKRGRKAGREADCADRGR